MILLILSSCPQTSSKHLQEATGTPLHYLHLIGTCSILILPSIRSLLIGLISCPMTYTAFGMVLPRLLGPRLRPIPTSPRLTLALTFFGALA